MIEKEELQSSSPPPSLEEKFDEKAKSLVTKEGVVAIDDSATGKENQIEGQ